MKKRQTKPPRRQKEYISGSGLDASGWLVKSEDADCLYLVSRKSGRNRRIPKEKRGCRPYGKS